MNAAVATEVLLRRQAGAQADLPLATPEVQRWVWESRYGPMLIEVVRGRVFVNGQAVEPHLPETLQRA
jgi:hypothetical protein